MRYYYTPAFSVLALFSPQAEMGLFSIHRMLRARRSPLFLLFISVICFSLLYGIAFSYDYRPGVRLIGSDAEGAVLELKVDELAVESKEFNDRDYHLISYEGCAFTSEVGRPQLPVSRVFIGVPPQASIFINVVDSQSTNLYGYIPFPVPEKVQRTSSDGIDTLADEFVIDGEFYRQNVFYPSVNAALIYEGYIRHQRVAVIELRPVQYNPATKLLRKCARLVVRVNFSSNKSSPSMQSPSALKLMPTPYLRDRDFEKLYQGLLINYDDARDWRKARSSAARAPVMPQESEAFKILISRSGIYRLDYATLQEARVDLSKVDPRTIKLQIRGNQVPIYIQGEADGVFDPEDYIEFFAPEADNIYTRWDVYRLTYGGARGMRMIQKNSVLNARAAREVTFYKSVVRFEEDHLHSKLQNVQPDPNNLEAWFESRDHWFWAGVENGSAKNEVTVKFPVYDLAQSMVRPDFKIELVGGTNYEHNVMISVNGYKIGEEAHWDRQDVYSFDGQMPGNALNEGINELRLTRIGTNPADGSNVDSYPHQIYLNWFEVGYIRKLLAVDDGLEFFAPEPKDPSVKEVNRYSIAGFLNSDIEIFQIAGSNAVCRFKDVAVKSYRPDQDERNRMKTINSMLDESSIQYPVSSIETAYTVTFEDQGGQHSRYIAVSSFSVMKPDRVVRDVPSNLKDPSNQADYIIISHPDFMDAARELAKWREEARGGGFKVKVVDVTDIYDEFGFGMVNPKAIKDFLKFAYENWAEPTISTVLIMGDATYDFLGIDNEVYKNPPELTGFIPTFYLWTTFGQTAVDHWYSTIDGEDGFPDIYLGRIPVENISQAQTVVEKIIANESGRVNGPWRKQIISAADDDTHAAGDEIFQIGLEEIWRDHTPLGYDTEKIYLKDIAKQVEQNPQETRRPADVALQKIIDAFGRGAVVAQYAGHGGRHVWAHEIMFSITDIEKMKEVDVYPFLLVLSCYNGYFDLPGELCMAEGLLRANRSGIIAMLSATRLTYGAGNVALNEALFDGIFKDKMLRIGQLTAASKIRVLVEEGISWLSQMQEYTLFGDPGSRLNIADYEIYPQLGNAVVTPGGKLELRAGQVLNTEGGQPGSFNGEITATVSLPDGREISKKVTAIKGSYPAVSFDMPANIVATTNAGVLKLYGQNDTEIVVGGTKFSIEEPVLLSLDHEITGDKLQFYAEVNDDAGPSGIKSVSFNWLSFTSRIWTESPMNYDQQKKVYKLAQPIPLSFQGGDLIYYITIEDRDGNSVSTDQQTLKLPSKPNMTFLSLLSNSESDISYSYSPQLLMWGISAGVKNTGTEKVTCPVQILAFGSDPDINDDRVVDDNVRVLGQMKLNPEDWNDDSTSMAFIPLSLPAGRHTIFLWIDPEFNVNHPENVYGACAEGSEADNIAFKTLNVTHVLLGPGQEGSTRSLDSVFYLSAPAGAVNDDGVATVELIQDVHAPSNQPGISFAPLPEGSQVGYMLKFVGSTSVGDNYINDDYEMQFDKPVSIQMKFDLAPLIEEAKKETSLTNLSEEQMSSDQKTILEQTLKARISNMAVYLWNEAARKWARMPSKPELDSSGDVMRIVHSTTPVIEASTDSNPVSKWIGNITIDAGANTPLDKWMILFLDTQHFSLIGEKTGTLKRNNETFIGTAGEEFHDQPTGFRFTVTQGANPFAAKDQFTFDTILVGTIQADTQSSGTFTLMLNQDNRPPDLQLGIGDQNFADGDVVASEPTIQALIYDENGVDVLTHKLGIGISKDSGDFEPAGESDYVLHWDANSNEVSVNYWPGRSRRLEPGTYKVRVQAYDYNGNLGSATIKFTVKREFELGKDSLMNYPNPFERETKITFHLTSLADEAIVKIYTVSGRLIRTLEQHYVVNFVVIPWDGKDEDGREVANGVYYYKVRLKQEGKKDIVEIGKMMKLK